MQYRLFSPSNSWIPQCRHSSGE